MHIISSYFNKFNAILLSSPLSILEVRNFYPKLGRGEEALSNFQSPYICLSHILASFLSRVIFQMSNLLKVTFRVF